MIKSKLKQRGDQTRFGLVLVSSIAGNFQYSQVLIWFRCPVTFFRASLQDSLDISWKSFKKIRYAEITVGNV